MMISLIKKDPSWITIVGIWLWMASCNGCKESHAVNQEQVVTLDDLVRNNKKVHEQEMMSIEAFVKEKNWPVTKTGTGLQYWVYENGNGQVAKLEDIVTLAFHIELMDGSACYDASLANPKKFRVGHDNVESGLHEVVQLLHVGDKAKVVLPSHLAFGLTGDNNKIPQNATVIYDLQIIAIE
jgi:FKBP-type peptidyl-prolyl cis-trans isomerase FkpA